MRAIMTYPLCFPCLRSHRSHRHHPRRPVVAAAAFPPPPAHESPPAPEPPRLWPHHHEATVRRGEALIKWLDAWGQVDEKAMRAWLMPAIDEEPTGGPGRRRSWTVAEPEAPTKQG